MRENGVGEEEGRAERKKEDKSKMRDKERQGAGHGVQRSTPENKTADSGLQNSDLLSSPYGSDISLPVITTAFSTAE